MPTYELPNDDFGTLESFNTTQKRLARTTVRRFVKDDNERAELFDMLDIHHPNQGTGD